jgi:predicted secreted protein
MTAAALFGGAITFRRSAVAIAEVKGVRGPSLSAGVVDVTSLESANDVREFIGTLKDGGTASFTLNYIPTANGTGHQLMVTDMLNSAIVSYSIVFPNAVTMTFNGIVTGFEISAELEQAIQASVTIKVTGWPTWT